MTKREADRLKARNLNPVELRQELIKRAKAKEASAKARAAVKFLRGRVWVEDTKPRVPRSYRGSVRERINLSRNRRKPRTVWAALLGALGLKSYRKSPRQVLEGVPNGLLHINPHKNSN